jgi:hypothetical protein
LLQSHFRSGIVGGGGDGGGSALTPPKETEQEAFVHWLWHKSDGRPFVRQDDNAKHVTATASNGEEFHATRHDPHATGVDDPQATSNGPHPQFSVRHLIDVDFKPPDLTAAAPFTYNHDTGGGAYNDKTIGDFNDVTEQLEGGTFGAVKTWKNNTIFLAISTFSICFFFQASLRAVISSPILLRL